VRADDEQARSFDGNDGRRSRRSAVRDADAQTYPSRPVRWIVPFPPGGPTDIVARPMGQWLSERLGQPFVIDNRPGGGGNIGAEAVVKAPPDGHMLLMFTPSSAINATLYKKLNFNFLRDIAPVASLTRQPLVMVINPSVPARTIPEFIAYAKAHPDKVNFASAGSGTGPHMAGELFKMMAGVSLVHVPYRGSAPALTDLLGGQVQVMFVSPLGLMDYLESGKLRALAVTTATRSAALPNIPTIGEFVQGYETTSWFGVGAPKNTPDVVVDRLNKEINTALADAAMKARISDIGATAFPGSPAAFGKLIAEETEKWAKVIAFTGITAE
jgi:tripartite-type tricarboxylate transporter receptor subunit TctC